MIDPAYLLSLPPLVESYRYDARDVMLHALATGLCADAMDEAVLPFVYESADRPLRVLPTLPIVLGWVDMVRDPRMRIYQTGIAPGDVVVGQIELTVKRQVAPQGCGRASTRYAEVFDKGEGGGALVCVRRTVEDEFEGEIATIDTWLFVRGAGGFGGRPGAGVRRPLMPDRPPDAMATHVVGEPAALLYRLVLGDHNALHGDPVHARKVGFSKPILHGLATLSGAVHGVVRALYGVQQLGESHEVTAGASMTRPVFPGDRLTIEAWRVEHGASFRVLATDRREVVVDGGYLEFPVAVEGKRRI